MRRGARSLAVCALAGLAFWALPAADATADDAPEGWAYDLWDELMSPYCPGRTLANCTSSQAEQLRMWILVQEAGGRSRDDVKEELLERFGDVIRAAPRASGWGLMAYVVPVLAFLGGGVVVALFVRRQVGHERESAASGAPTPAAVDSELERIVDEELAR